MRPELPEVCDVLVVGAGPAGLSAATELARAGAGQIVVVDREPSAGGIPRHCDHSPFGMREFGRVLRGPAYARRLADTAKGAGVEIRLATTVSALRAGPEVALSTKDGSGIVRAQCVILATGVREKSRAGRLIGGTKPGGVMTTGALQGLVHLAGAIPFRRPVVLGTELVSFSALLTCRHAGISPVAMADPGTRTTARWPAALLPRVLGVPLLLETEVIAADGERWVTSVTLQSRDGSTFQMAADGLLVTGSFLPEASLLAGSHIAVDAASGGPLVDEYGRCSDPAYFAAGNLLRPVETAGWCWSEGRRVARAVVDGLAGRLPDRSAARTITFAGEGLKYVMPQRLAAGSMSAALSHFQLRASHALSGRLVALADGREVYARAMKILPERRILVPVNAVGGSGPVEFQFREAP